MIGGGVGQDVERAHRADLDHHLERLAEQEIADQHARLVAPKLARGGPAAPHVAFVHHVVVQQRRGVHEFDRGGELDVAVAGIAGQARHRQRQHRPQPLAAGRDQMVGDLRDHRHLGAGARQNLGVDPLHVGRDQLDQAVDGGVGRTEWDDDGQVRSPDFVEVVRKRIETL